MNQAGLAMPTLRRVWLGTERPGQIGKLERYNRPE